MSRFAFCSLIVAIASQAFAQDLAKKISVDIPASRAVVALSALGKAAGLDIEPAANLRDEVFVISAHDVTIQDIMDHLAQAESGKWIKQSGMYLLTRDRTVTLSQEKAELAARTAVISQAIAKLNGVVVPSSKFDQATAQKLADDTSRVLDGAGDRTARNIDASASIRKTPTARAIAKILTGIDPAKLAQIGMNQRVVFSTQPTPMQVPLGSIGYNAFTQFISEQQLYARAYKTNQPQDGTTRIFFVNGLSNPTLGKGDPSLGLGLGLIVVERRSEGVLAFQLLATDTKFETISSSNYLLRTPVGEDPAPSTSGDDVLQISPEAKELATAIGGSNGSSSQPRAIRAISLSGNGGGGDFTVQSVDSDDSAAKISPELRSKILNPEKFDPLSFAPGEAMIALSKQKNKNLVALLPDYCFGSMNRQFAGNVTAAQFLASLSATHGLIEKEDENWIVAAPAMPSGARANTGSRSALGSLLRSMEKNGTLRLDDVAGFALAQDKVPGMNDFDVAYPRLINTGAANRYMMPLATGSYSLYKFYGTLSQGQRQSIEASQQLPFMNLSQQQTALIADMVYNSLQGPNVQLQDQAPPNGATTGVTFAFTSQAGGGPMPMMIGGSLSAQTERTIVLPNGITNDGFVQGSAKTQQAVQATNSQTGATNFFDAPSLAFNRSPAAAPPETGFTPTQYDKFRMAHQTNINLRFMFTPRITLSRSLTDTSPDADSQSVGYDSLPGDFRARVQQAAAQMQGVFQKFPVRRQGAPPPSK